MPVNLAALETFFWIVRLGTFHAAATKLNVSQPAVSARIRELEASLGLELFDRVGRSVRPTPQGRKVYEYADRILGEVENLVQQTGAAPAVSGTATLTFTSPSGSQSSATLYLQSTAPPTNGDGSAKFKTCP